MNETFPNTKTVYGPVKSWRLGMSLGIDPIFHTSTCSFNCIYCQLGEIQNVTTEHKEYVPTKRVVDDVKELLEKNIHFDVITYSGSGEPTLASNLGKMEEEIRKIAPNAKQFVLTNATELHINSVQENLKNMDKVIIKLDATDEKTFKLFNRPEETVTLEKTIEGICSFVKNYKGLVEIQTMFMGINSSNEAVFKYCEIINKISPDIVQLNTPKRPYPLSWHRENRGNHLGIFDYEVRELQKVSKERALEIEKIISEKTNVEILSIYK